MKRDDAKAPSWSLAFVTIAFSVAVLYTSQSIGEPEQLRKGDVGLKAFPVGLSALLLLGGLVELTRCLIARQKSKLAPRGKPDNGTFYMLIALAGIVAYILLIPVLGFALASFLFAISAMVYLRTSWVSAVVCALILVALIQVLFVVVFKVQLPRGVFFADRSRVPQVAVRDDANRELPDASIALRRYKPLREC